MSILPKETIKVLAEAAGIANLKDDVAAALAPDVEYRVREVIQESVKFMRHSKRQKLTADDVNRALHIHNVDPLYGFGAREPLRFRRLPAAAAAGTDVYYVEDEELDCMELIKAPLPPIPLAPTYTSHWLAIEGVQPAIPQNPLPQEVELSHVVASGAAIPVIPVSDKASSQAASNAAGGADGASTSAVPEGLVVVDAGATGAQVKPLVKHVLSREMQTYYEKITTSVLRPDAASRKHAYSCLRTDPSLHQLVPYFVQFVADKVTKHLTDVDALSSLMWVVRSLVDNSNLFLEPYLLACLDHAQLHQLMPPVLTCIVGKQLCRNPATDDHWAVRELAAAVVAAICRIGATSKYGDAYTTLQPRVAKTLLRAFLDPLKPLATHYGAIHGLMALGKHALQMLLLPNVKTYVKLLEPQMRPDPANPTRAADARRCYTALLAAVGSCFREPTDGPGRPEAEAAKAIPDDLRVSYDEMVAVFGDALTPYVATTVAAPMLH